MSEEVTPEEATPEQVRAADLMVFEPRAIEIPGTGEVVQSNDVPSCARALESVRQYERMLKEVKIELTGAIAEQSRLIGTKTFALGDHRKAVLKSGTEIVYDAEGLERDLRELGMPEHRIRQIVRETVSYSVVAVEAKRAAAANPEYARVVEANRREVSRPEYVSIVR